MTKRNKRYAAMTATGLSILSLAWIATAQQQPLAAPAGETENGVVIDVPDAVRQGIRKEIGADKVLDLRRETDDGNVGYLATVKGTKGEYQLRVDTSGNLVRKWVERPDEQDVKVKYETLPEAFRSSVITEVAGADIKQIVRHDRKTTYTVYTAAGTNYFKIETDADGALIEKARTDELPQEENVAANGQ